MSTSNTDWKGKRQLISNQHTKHDQPFVWGLKRIAIGEAKDSVVLGVSYVLQVLFQCVFFMAISRMLGPDMFGRFAAAMAAISLVSPLAGLGLSEVALIRVSQDRESSGRWMTASIRITAVMGFVLTLVLALGAILLSGDDWLVWYVIFGLAVNELILSRCTLIMSRIHQARREAGRAAMLNVSLAGVKAVLAAGLYFFAVHSLTVFVVLVCLVNLVVLLGFSSHFVATFAGDTASPNVSAKDMRLAGLFTVSVFSKSVYTDLDKLLLAAWTSPFVVGTYAAGFKVCTLSFTPIRGVLEATFPRQVELAKSNPVECFRYTMKLVAFNVLLGATVGAFVYWAAPWISFVLGDAYADAVPIIRLACFLPCIQAVHVSLGNHLSANEQQTYRTTTQLIVVGCYVIVGFMLVPTFGWRGAVATSLCSESVLAVLSLIGVGVFVRRAKPKETAAVSLSD